MHHGDRQKAEAGRALLAAEIIAGARELRKRGHRTSYEIDVADLTVATLKGYDLESIVALLATVRQALDSDAVPAPAERTEVSDELRLASGVRVTDTGDIRWSRFDA